MYVYPKKKVTYLGGQVGDQAWKFSYHWVKAGRIGNPTGRYVEPCKMYQNLVSWACPKFIFTPKSYQFNNNDIKLAMQIQSVIKTTFKHFLLKDFLKPIHKFKPLTGTTSTPVTFIGEYPLPPRIGPCSCPKHLFQREAKSDAIDIEKCFFILMETKFLQERLCT